MMRQMNFTMVIQVLVCMISAENANKFKTRFHVSFLHQTVNYDVIDAFFLINSVSDVHFDEYIKSD